MSTLYPGALDDSSTLPNPSATNPTNSPSLASGQSNQNDAIKAAETKLGTGASTPASNTLLIGTGTGTSAWSALTSSQLAGVISDETGTGSAVFATTPTLVTPKVDTINESTLNNGVTVGGVNLKSGAVTATTLGGTLSSNNAVGTSNITANSVLSGKLGLSNAFTGGVASQTNAGTAGGTMYYVNLGGIKMLWMISSTISINSSTGVTQGVTFPTSFFTTIQTVTVSMIGISGDVRISASTVGALTTTGGTLASWNTAGLTTSTGTYNLFVIGT